MYSWVRVLVLVFIGASIVFSQSTADVSRLRLQLTLDGHTGAITTLAISPSGEFMASGGYDGNIQIWNINSKKQVIQLLGHEDRISGISFNEDESKVMTASFDGSVKVWDTQNRRELSKKTVILGSILSMSASNNLQFFAVATSDNVATVWNSETNIKVFETNVLDRLHVVSLSPNGRYLVTGEALFTRVWDLTTGKLLRTYTRDVYYSNSVTQISSDGKKLAVSGDDKIKARIYDFSTGTLLFKIEGVSASALAFSNDSDILAIGNLDGVASIWNIRTGIEFSKIKANSTYVSSLKLSPDGYTLFSASDFDGGYEVNEYAVQIWNVLTGNKLGKIGLHKSVVRGLEFSPDGKLLATAGYDDTIRLWDSKSGIQIEAIAHQEVRPTALAFTRDNRYLITGSMDGILRLWEVSSGTLVRTFQQIGRNPILHLAISDDNKTFIASTTFGYIFKYQLDTRNLISERKLYPYPNVFTVSSNGRLIATGGEDGAKLWDIDSGRQLLQFTELTQIRSIAISPDDKTIAVGGQGKSTIRLFDTLTGQEVKSFGSFNTAILALEFSPNGKILAVGGWNKKVQLWEISTGKQILELRDNRGLITTIAFSPDGTQIATGSNDTARIYSTPDLAPVFNTRPNLAPTATTTAPQPSSGLGFNLSLKASTTHPSITATHKGCIRANTANLETVACRVIFDLKTGETPLQVASVRTIDTASRVVIPYQFAFLIPNSFPNKNATLSSTAPLTLEYFMTIPKDITRLPITEIKIGNSSLWEYTTRFDGVSIAQ